MVLVLYVGDAEQSKFVFKGLYHAFCVLMKCPGVATGLVESVLRGELIELLIL
ncbi:hypothetical protein DPMN_074701 [Dreissena polymorpha]|uniref:Uncharacterized protein n=1 Tax=Dreissena polymorpha TaxID=45954 RepID=A0A9D4BKW3_DREPO|nr:hypothetical protein DPMN_074701 [Dreissena polymorpha]